MKKNTILMILALGMMSGGFYNDVFAADATEITSLQTKADAGDVIAQYNLGVMYAQGTGVEADKQMAIQWLTKAANKGFKPAREILNKIE